jgi:hypothetical protein
MRKANDPAMDTKFGSVAPSSSEAGPTASKAMTHEEYMKELSRDPRFKVRRGTGEGFIFGGQHPSRMTKP